MINKSEKEIQKESVQIEYQNALSHYDDCVLLLRLDPQNGDNYLALTLAIARLQKADKAVSEIIK